MNLIGGAISRGYSLLNLASVNETRLALVGQPNPIQPIARYGWDLSLTNGFSETSAFKIDFACIDLSSGRIIYSDNIVSDLLPSDHSWTRTVYATIPYPGNFKFEANATRVGDSEQLSLVSAEQEFEVPWLDFYQQSIILIGLLLLASIALICYVRKKTRWNMALGTRRW